jgi:hypothetical protein
MIILAPFKFINWLSEKLLALSEAPQIIALAAGVITIGVTLWNTISSGEAAEDIGFIIVAGVFICGIVFAVLMFAGRILSFLWMAIFTVLNVVTIPFGFVYDKVFNKYTELTANYQDNIFIDGTEQQEVNLDGLGAAFEAYADDVLGRTKKTRRTNSKFNQGRSFTNMFKNMPFNLRKNRPIVSADGSMISSDYSNATDNPDVEINKSFFGKKKKKSKTYLNSHNVYGLNPASDEDSKNLLGSDGEEVEVKLIGDGDVQKKQDTPSINTDNDETIINKTIEDEFADIDFYDLEDDENE